MKKKIFMNLQVENLQFVLMLFPPLRKNLYREKRIAFRLQSKKVTSPGGLSITAMVLVKLSLLLFIVKILIRFNSYKFVIVELHEKSDLLYLLLCASKNVNGKNRKMKDK